jgi:choice-of-anchor A domain-containing protein
MTLKGIDPTVNVFYVPSSDFVNTYSITINVPSSSTVIINVSGSSVSIKNMGISSVNGYAGLLWNLYEANSLTVSSVGLPGSVLAPFANASLGGNMAGTLIAETVVSNNEFHQWPFQHNWLVP